MAGGGKTPAQGKRSHHVHVILNEEEWNKLARIAGRTGHTTSSLLRILIQRVEEDGTQTTVVYT